VHYEPRLALDGGTDGLAYYRRIARQAPDYLQDNGRLCLELGDNQAEAVKKILAESRRFSGISLVNDYTGTERVIIAQLWKN
jgi:release factor glutamine methyltransferase